MKKKSKILLLCTLAVFATSALAYLYMPTLAAQPGSTEDPLVTRNYVDMRITELSNEIAILRGMLTGTEILPQPTPTPPPIPPIDPPYMPYVPIETTPPPTAQQTAVFDVLHLQMGQTVTFHAGTEFILRGGSAVAITGEYNGIPDVTAAHDVLNGEPIGLNHLLMIPFTDGRGILLTAESWVMVRGGYTILS
ncbi:MAG: hypothetical protein FWF81_11475 [Defluviitaleaceae bacterium]|nr:hypothetical protein [Defluviitaleaceae bacterium]